MSDFSELKKDPISSSSEASKGDDIQSKKKRRDFWRGVFLCSGLLIGFYALVIPFAIQVIEFNTPTEKILTYQQICTGLPAAGIIALMIFLAFKRPQVARGMAASLGGFVVLLLILLVLVIMIFGIGCGGLGGC